MSIIKAGSTVGIREIIADPPLTCTCLGRPDCFHEGKCTNVANYIVDTVNDGNSGAFLTCTQCLDFHLDTEQEENSNVGSSS